MQWHLQQIAAMSGAAGIFEELEDDDDFDADALMDSLAFIESDSASILSDGGTTSTATTNVSPITTRETIDVDTGTEVTGEQSLV